MLDQHAAWSRKIPAAQVSGAVLDFPEGDGEQCGFAGLEVLPGARPCQQPMTQHDGTPGISDACLV